MMGHVILNESADCYETLVDPIKLLERFSFQFLQLKLSDLLTQEHSFDYYSTVIVYIFFSRFQHKHKKVKSKSKDLQKSPDVSQDKHADELQQLQQQSAATKPLIANPAKSIKTAISPVHEQYEIIHQNMALEFRDHDGQSERPGGAVLSLTLGLLITAALAILIGCRMRTVGRRARRMGGKTPYSHEADFLVNGMYL